MNEILNKIKEYNTIIIERHENPDLDALGSQLGLKYALKANFQDKEIYAVGDMNRFDFLGEMDIISEECKIIRVDEYKEYFDVGCSIYSKSFSEYVKKRKLVENL